jgi:candidapepsin
MAPTSFAPSTVPGFNTPAGTIAASLSRGADLSAYFAQFSVGTPQQKEWLLIDTGSPTISFFDSQGTFSKESTKPCTYYGAFDNLTSS